MKAIVYEQYGPPEVLELKDIDTPVVNDDEVLVGVRAAAVRAGDWHHIGGEPYILRLMGYGLRTPKHQVAGRDVAGQVQGVGKNVTQFRPGDAVFGWSGWRTAGTGAFAEYVAVSQDALAPKPANLTFEQAAAVPDSALVALQGLRDHGQVQPGQLVLINGASGGVGTFAVQLAKAFGAEVTAVCSTGNVNLVRSIGADHIIDYTQEDFTTSGERYDLILDIAANHSLSACRRALTPKGTYVLIGNSGGRWLGGLRRFVMTRVLSRFVRQRMRSFEAKGNKADLVALKELIEVGKITPVIDRHYPLRDVPEAIRYLETGHAQGKVVITVGNAAAQKTT